MQTNTEADPFWRWHDRMGIPRPGASVRRVVRERARAMLGDGRFKPAAVSLSGADRARADLMTARKRLAYIEAVRTAEWEEYCAGKRASPYGDLTIREWRAINVKIAYYEHTLIPMLDDIERFPFRRMPIELPAPTDSWVHDDFVPNPPLVRKMREVPPALTACHWCKAAVPVPKITIDHVVPQWARPLSPKLAEATKNVPACQTCNHAKGPMPPALFTSVRCDQHATKLHRIAWGAVAQKFSNWPDRERFAYLIPEIEVEMLKPC